MTLEGCRISAFRVYLKMTSGLSQTYFNDLYIWMKNSLKEQSDEFEKEFSVCMIFIVGFALVSE